LNLLFRQLKVYINSFIPSIFTVLLAVLNPQTLDSAVAQAIGVFCWDILWLLA